MPVEEIHAGDIGTTVLVTFRDGTTVVDISNASIKQLIFKKPDNTTSTKNGTYVTDGTDGQLKYVTVDGDWDIAGKWAIQGYIEDQDGNKYKSDIKTFRVYDNL